MAGTNAGSFSERVRTPTDVGGHNAAGSVVGDGCCGIEAGSQGTRRTRTELRRRMLE